MGGAWYRNTCGTFLDAMVGQAYFRGSGGRAPNGMPLVASPHAPPTERRVPPGCTAARVRVVSIRKLEERRTEEMVCVHLPFGPLPC